MLKFYSRRVLGQKWAATSEEDRQEFRELAEQDKERYKREMLEYEKKLLYVPVAWILDCAVRFHLSVI